MNAMAKAEGDARKLELAPGQAMPALPAALSPNPAPQPKKRRGKRLVLMFALPLLLAAGGAYVWVTGGRYQETDNANLQQAIVSIAAQKAGRVVETHVVDNGMVKSGDVLFVIDPQPYRIALEQADAALAAARLSVEQLRSAYSQAIAQEHVASGEVTYMKTEFARQSDLAGKGISSRALLDQAQRNLTKARDEEEAAREAVGGALAALGGKPDLATDSHPSVLAAVAARDKAAWDLEQTTVRAPADGMISQAASFKLGELIGENTPLFSLVETDEAWVDANFKETQLTHMKPGQTAEIELDTYPGQPIKATVEAIGAGTGAEFSLLPAQNATGNWVKVTQRIPVRLKVDTGDTDLALRTGMSADVTVDTGVARGLPRFAALPESVAGLFGTANAAE
ncbi:HlyD family secretion protein [Mesorhizobium sp. LHD-90]|uniref:HlyD family secretion protein n=1 Tax=Mesorhizobium sp. LHD-90 TaxID=3071414 RepID=UPI0027E0308E|nr:HlyD family secretion protein [Mesorhizobium sp. LHD-90]MDQ6436128.1 HlyD family secretion protein [Mesorhizobium sp. LHD-90]